jgi:hypothetical protein
MSADIFALILLWLLIFAWLHHTYSEKRMRSFFLLELSSLDLVVDAWPYIERKNYDF